MGEVGENGGFRHAGGQTQHYRMASCGLAESSCSSFRTQDYLQDYACACTPIVVRAYACTMTIVHVCTTIKVRACTMITVHA